MFNFLHLIGAFLLLAASILLLVVSITAPVIDHLALLRVSLPGSSFRDNSINMGTFGYCYMNANSEYVSQSWSLVFSQNVQILCCPSSYTHHANTPISGSKACSSSQIGYRPTSVISSALNIDSDIFSRSATNSSRILTRVMVLHPIAAGVAFIGAIIGLLSGPVGSFIASVIAFVVFLISLVAVICDFVLFHIIKRNINNSNSGARAHYSSGMWLVLAGTICALLASIWLFFTCCFARRRNNQRRKTTTI